MYSNDLKKLIFKARNMGKSRPSEILSKSFEKTKGNVVKNNVNVKSNIKKLRLGIRQLSEKNTKVTSTTLTEKVNVKLFKKRYNIS